MAINRHPVTEEIEKAFLQLMTEKPFADITVSDIVKQAGIARASFYRNYSSTSQVLETILDNLIDQFREHALPVLTSQDERQWRDFLFRYIYFMSDRYRQLLLSKTFNASLFLQKMADTAREISLTAETHNIREKYSISSRIGIINSTLLHWIIEGRQESPEELVNYLMDFILTI